MKHKLLTLISIVMAGLVVLAACGPAASDVPSLGTKDTAQVKEPAPDADAGNLLQENEAKMMAFTQCLRDQGAEMLDPVVDADGNVGKPQLAEGAEWKGSLKTAWAACAEHLEGFVLEKKRVDVSEQVDQAVALAACMRAKGHDVGDPTAETLDQWQEDFKDSISWDDHAAVADYEECSGGTVGGRKGK